MSCKYTCDGCFKEVPGVIIGHAGRRRTPFGWRTSMFGSVVLDACSEGCVKIIKMNYFGGKYSPPERRQEGQGHTKAERYFF